METIEFIARRHAVGLKVAAFVAVALLVSIVQIDAAEASNRKSCAQISGTHYHSPEEREWYWAHCLGTPLTKSSGSSSAEQFAAGYRSSGGPERLLSHILNIVIPCESTYNPYAVNPSGPYYGLMQFSLSTWYWVGGGDWSNAWQQGANTAKLLLRASPRSHWANCW